MIAKSNVSLKKSSHRFWLVNERSIRACDEIYVQIFVGDKFKYSIQKIWQFIFRTIHSNNTHKSILPNPAGFAQQVNGPILLSSPPFIHDRRSAELEKIFYIESITKSGESKVQNL